MADRKRLDDEEFLRRMLGLPESEVEEEPEQHPKSRSFLERSLRERIQERHRRLDDPELDPESRVEVMKDLIRRSRAGESIDQTDREQYLASFLDAIKGLNATRQSALQKIASRREQESQQQV